MGFDDARELSHVQYIVNNSGLKQEALWYVALKVEAVRKCFIMMR